MPNYGSQYYLYRKLVQDEKVLLERKQTEALLNLRGFYENNFNTFWFRLFFPGSLAQALQEEPLSPSKVYLSYFSRMGWIHFFFGSFGEIKSFDADNITKTCLSLYEDNQSGEGLNGRSLLRDDKFSDIQIYAASPNFEDLNSHPRIINDETFADRVRALQFLQGQQDHFSLYFEKTLLVSSNFILKGYTNIVGDLTCLNLAKLDKDDLRLINEVISYSNNQKSQKKINGTFPLLKIIIDSGKEKSLLPILHFLMSQKSLGAADNMKSFTIPLLLLSEVKIQEYLKKIQSGEFSSGLALEILNHLLKIEDALNKPIPKIASVSKPSKSIEISAENKTAEDGIKSRELSPSVELKDTLVNLSVDPMANLESAVKFFSHAGKSAIDHDVWNEILILEPDEKEVNFFDYIIKEGRSLFVQKENIILIHKFYNNYKDNLAYLEKFKNYPREILAFMQNPELSEYYKNNLDFIINFENISELYKRILLAQEHGVLDVCSGFDNQCFAKNLTQEQFISLIKVISQLLEIVSKADLVSLINELLKLNNRQLQDLSLCLNVLSLPCNKDICNIENIKLAIDKAKIHVLFSDLQGFSAIFDGSKALGNTLFKTIMQDPHIKKDEGLHLCLSEYASQHTVKNEVKEFLRMGKGLFHRVSEMVHNLEKESANKPNNTPKQ